MVFWEGFGWTTNDYKLSGCKPYFEDQADEGQINGEVLIIGIMVGWSGRVLKSLVCAGLRWVA